MRMFFRAVASVLLAFGAVLGVFAATAGARTDSPSYALVTVGKFGGEPTIASSPTGVLYDTTPSGGTILYRSTNHGESWTKATTADKASGDDCVTTDQSGAVYECNLAGSKSAHPLEADSWKSLNEGRTWMYGNNPINPGGANICGTSCNPFGVDRQWEDAYIPKGKTTKQALVVLAYHDFYGPSSIWFNISTDGGKTFGPSTDIFAHTTPQNGPTAAVALADSACNTVPAGARIEKSGPHPGRIYVAWIASDPESAGTGCNVTMVQSFHNLFVAWSDDKGKSWTIALAYDAGIGHDASTPFTAFTIDNRGNPYMAFATPAPSDNPATCAQQSTAGKVQKDKNCAYHMWVVWSKNGGKTWDGGGGAISGSAKTAYEVDPSRRPQTDVFPAIAAGDPGKVDVAWLGTNEIEPTDPLGKFDPGGCAGPNTPGAPSFYPPRCKWNLYAAQSLNLRKPPHRAKFKITRATRTPMHVGDICNLGIFCTPGLSNRNLLDFISETVDPTTGCGHIAYADDHNPKAKLDHLRVANQMAGPSIESGARTCHEAARKRAVGHLRVFVGYADTLRAKSARFPSPWAPAVTVYGNTCAKHHCDNGAIRLVNKGSGPLRLKSVVVKLSTCTFDSWPHNLKIAPGKQIILSNEGHHGAHGCPNGGFDTSDVGPNGRRWNGDCHQSGVIPRVAITTASGTKLYRDTGQVLNTGGIDKSSCPKGSNESVPWTLIGSHQ